MAAALTPCAICGSPGCCAPAVEEIGFRWLDRGAPPSRSFPTDSRTEGEKRAAKVRFERRRAEQAQRERQREKRHWWR